MSPAERLALDALAEQRELERLPFRAFLESPEYCGLELSRVVAAIADAADGVRPTTITDAECLEYFGCALDALPTERRRTVAVQAGGRGGKTSRLLAPKALHAAWTVPLPTLADKEHAVALILSSELVFAKQALSFCVGYVERSPRMRGALVGEPGAESITLRRPDGKLVDIRVRAAGAKGKGGRAFTLVFAGLDEACFFNDEASVVSDKEIHRAVIQRIVPGGQEWMVSTPWVEGEGLLEEQLASNWGNHAGALAVRGVGTRSLNPTWDPTGEIEAELRKDDPDNADREIGAKPLSAGTTSFFSHEAIEAAINEDLEQEAPPTSAATYGAGGDMGFVKNSSALAIVARSTPDPARPERYRLARLEERKPVPGQPLQPEAVTAEFGGIATKYGERDLVVDSHEIAKVRDALLPLQMNAVLAPEKEETFVLARRILHEGRFEMPLIPRLRAQLREVRTKALPGGGVRIFSRKKADGSHGDLAHALINALWAAGRVRAVTRPRSGGAGTRAGAFG